MRVYDSATPWTDDSDPTDRSYLHRVKDHGGVAVSVYIRGTPGGMRHANVRDVHAARDLGLGVIPNWESTADFFRTATLDDCRNAAQDGLAAARTLGFPDDGTIQLPYSFDYQIPGDQLDRARGQVAAIQDVIGGAYIVTAYGQSSLIRYLHNNGFGDRTHWLMGSTWQASSSIPQPSDVYDIGQPGVAMVQSHHLDGSWFPTPVSGTDVNVITQVDKLAAWWPEGSEHSVGLSNEDKDWIDHRLALFGRAMLTGQDSGPFDNATYPAWVDEPGLRDVVLKTLAVLGNPANLAAAIAADLQDVPADRVQAACERAVQKVFAAAANPS